jgi:hypothetical protein
MAVSDPAARADVHFHVARAGRPVAEPNDRTPEIRAAFPADESGMKHLQGFTV